MHPFADELCAATSIYDAHGRGKLTQAPRQHRRGRLPGLGCGRWPSQRRWRRRQSLSSATRAATAGSAPRPVPPQGCLTPPWSPWRHWRRRSSQHGRGCSLMPVCAAAAGDMARLLPNAANVSKQCKFQGEAVERCRCAISSKPQAVDFNLPKLTKPMKIEVDWIHATLHKRCV